MKFSFDWLEDQPGIIWTAFIIRLKLYIISLLTKALYCEYSRTARGHLLWTQNKRLPFKTECHCKGIKYHICKNLHLGYISLLEFQRRSQTELRFILHLLTF